jgi:hypothetical protein
MAVTGVSEFTFGFAFLFEQTTQNWANLRAAPILPSLYSGLGKLDHDFRSDFG